MKIICRLFFVFLVILTFAACSSTQSGNSKKTEQIQELKNVYNDYFLLGNIINNRYLRDPEYMEIITKHFNIVTAENEMKPDQLAPRERGGQYNFANADRLVNEMLAQNIKVHGHTLVWHKQTRAWMTQGTPEQVRQNLVNHINTVMAHYKGKIFSWDVVNEAVLERVNPGTNLNDWKIQLRNEEDSGWFRVLGSDYIELAFRTARAADPDVMLYYNDYNLNNSRKAQVVANMVKQLNDKYKSEGNTRNLIDGIGMQAHYNINTSAPQVRQSIELFISIGVKVDISELDVEIKIVGSNSFGTGKDSPTNESEQKLQAIKYAELFSVFMEYKEHIPRVSMWGIDDESSWKSMGNPCLWDNGFNLKQAFFAVADPSKFLIQ
ncbi:MAG: endo-1,4-beta-xylanase [Treponema sp.]|nr:endo-1,4-beta-xylanase [Treponema sp.]